MTIVDTVVREDAERRPIAQGPPPEAPPAATAPPSRSRWKPTRQQLIVGAIGLLAAVLYTWGLSRNGMANSYYAAAVRSGAKSWKAFFFGSIDPGSFITVDKPPAAVWVMDLSARVFGFSSWSMLLPEAAAGLGSVLILHRLVRKWAGDLSAHLASLALALTPIAVAMFRFNNPDAFLTLVCLGAVWALWSALETGRTRALLLAGGLLGLGFETKMLQALLILPAMALVYLWAGRPRLRTRLWQLAAAGATMVAAAAWWVVIVALWPASSRPYIGSTTNNSIISLIFGYNGFARILGSSGGGGPAAAGGHAGGGGGGGMTFGGTPGALRLLNDIVGGQIAWFIPLAVLGLIAGLWLTRRGGRTDRGRAGWVLWGGWALACGAVFSLSKGIFHPYYTVQLAPAVAALAGAGAVALWEVGRRHRAFMWVLPATILISAGLAVDLLDRTPTYHAWLRPTIVVGAVVAAMALLVGSYLRQRLALILASGLATIVLLAGPAAYALTTISHATTGGMPSAGPTVSGAGFGGAGPGGRGGLPGATGGRRGTSPTAGGFAGFPGGGGTTGAAPAGAPTGAPTQGSAGGGFGGPGGSSVSAGLVKYLEANRDGAKYIVAAFTSNASAPIIIASGEPVITIGGFNGSDPAPTLTQFEKLVATGKVRYVLVSSGGGGGGPGGGSGTSISSWVTAHGTEVAASSYGGSSSGGTLYELSASEA